MPTLDTIAIFRGLALDRRRAIESRCEWRRFATGATIIEFGDKTDSVVCIVSGRVRVMIYSSRGRVVSLRDIGPGEVVGDFAAIDGLPRSASVEALVPTAAALIAGPLFRRILMEEASVTFAVLQRSVALSRELTQRVTELSTLDVSRRVWSAVLRMAEAAPERNGNAILDPFPIHDDIASLIGARREGVTRKLNDLEQSGIMRRLAPHVFAVDVKQLRQLVGASRELDA